MLVTPGSPATRAAGPVARHPSRHPATRPGASGRRHPTRGSLRLPLVPSHQPRPPAPSRRPAACKSLLERLPKVLLPSSLPSSLPGLPTPQQKFAIARFRRASAMMRCCPAQAKVHCCVTGPKILVRAARGLGGGCRPPGAGQSRSQLAMLARVARLAHDTDDGRPITIIIALSSHPLPILRRPSPRCPRSPLVAVVVQELPRAAFADTSTRWGSEVAGHPRRPFVDTSTRPRCGWLP